MKEKLNARPLRRDILAVYKDENGVTQADIPWEILFPSPQYYYNMVNVYNLLKLFVSNAQKTLINSIISQAKNAPDSTAGINAQLLDAASSAGSLRHLC